MIFVGTESKCHLASYRCFKVSLKPANTFLASASSNQKA